jgi:hypothetical protein
LGRMKGIGDRRRDHRGADLAHADGWRVHLRDVDFDLWDLMGARDLVVVEVLLNDLAIHDVDLLAERH